MADDFEYAPLATLPQQGAARPAADALSVIGASVLLGPVAQVYNQHYENMIPAQQGYNPYETGELKGYEKYSEWFLSSRSPSQTFAIKQRIDKNTEYRRMEDEDGSLWTGLVSAAFDPINYLPLPGVMGAGFVRGAIKTGLAVGAMQAAEGAVTMSVDPTAHIDEELAKMKYAAFFGAFIGGFVGRMGTEAAGRLGSEFIAEQRAKDEMFGIVPLETRARSAEGMPLAANIHPAGEGEGAASKIAGHVTSETGAVAEEQAPKILPNATYEVRETKEGGAGIASAYGAEVIAGSSNPFMRLVSSGFQALGDLAEAIGGEFSIKTKGNEQGLATMQSAFLRSGRWVAMSKDTYAKMESLWISALSGGESMTIGGLNVRATAQRTADASRELLRRADDGRITFQDFNKAVFHARTSGEIPTEINGKVLGEAMRDSIGKALPIVDGFFKQAEIEAVNTGWIKTEEYARRQALEWRNRLTSLAKDHRRLEGLATRTQAEEAQLLATNRALFDVVSRVKRIDYDRIASDAELAAIVDRNMDVVRNTQADAQVKFDALSATVEADKRIRQELADELQARLASGHELTPEQMELLDSLTSPEVKPVESTVRGGEVDPAAAEPRDKDWHSVFDQHGPRRADSPGTIDVPKHLAQLQDLSNLLAGHFDIPEVKVWMGDPVNPLRGGDMNYSDAVSKGGEMILNVHHNPMENLVVFLHEFSHAVDFNIFMNLAPAEKKAVQDAYQAWRRGVDNKSLHQVDNTAVLTGERDQAFSSLPANYQAYRADFVEWFAEQGVSWLTTDRAPTTAIESVFKGVADQWANLYRTVTGRDGTAVEMEKLFATRWKTGGQTLDQFLQGAPELQTALDNLKAAAERRSPALDALHAESDELLAKIMRGDIKFAGPSNEKNYLPHQWNVEKVLQDQAGPQRLNAILEQHFKDVPSDLHHPSPAEGARAFIGALITKDEDVIRTTSERLGWSNNRNRQLSISGEKIADFVETDVSQLIHNYAQRGGTGIEYSRMFKGDPLAKDAIHDAYIQAAKEWKGSKDEYVQAMRGWSRDIEVLMRTAQMRMGAGLALTADRVVIDTAVNFVNTALMGGVVKSAIVEAARPIMVHGLDRMIGFTLNGLIGQFDTFKAVLGDLRPLINEGWDVSHGMQAANWMADHGPRRATQTPLAQWMSEKTGGFNNFAQGHYFVMSGLAHITDMLKNYTMVMSSHFMIEDIRTLASGAADKRLASNLAAYGIDEGIAKAMMDMPIQKATYLNVPNLGKWEDQELAIKFASAVQGENRRIIVTPGPTDKTDIGQGFLYGKDGSKRDIAMLKLPFQFMSWGIAANNKVLLSALQGRDSGVMSGIIALTGMGYMSAWMKSSDAQWDKMSFLDKMTTAFELSGVAAGLTDINKTIEFGTNNTYGLRPALGLQPAFRSHHPDVDLATTPFGAVGSTAVKLYDVFTDPYMSRDQRANTIRRAVPLNNIPYLSNVFKWGQEAAMYGQEKMF